MRFRSFAAFILASATLCLAAPGSARADESQDGRAVYEYKTWDCRIRGNKLSLTVKNRLTINNRRGDGYRGLNIWENEFNRLVSVSARVLDAGGGEIYRREKGDMEKACGFGGVSLYNDACLYHTVLESSQYPYTIEYEYTLESSSLFFWPGAGFQHYIPVQYASYSLTVPSEFTFHHKLYDLEIEPEVSSSGGEIRYLWIARDIPALEEIDYLPPGCNEGARIEFVADRFSLDRYSLERCDWTGIGLWYHQMARDRYLAGGPTASGGASSMAARALFADVKERTRYVSVNVGVSGWQPHAASRTLELGYGDCKDMSTLLISRLMQQGIQAYPSLVLTRGEGVTDVDFPNFDFNHVITMAIVKGDTLWLDATSDNCPFGEVPWAVENLDALVVTAAGGQIRRIAGSTAQDNRRLRTTGLHINSDLRILLNVELQAFGNYAKFLRDGLESRDQDETRRFVNSQFGGAEKIFRIDSYEIRNLEDLEEPVVITLRASGVKPLRKIGPTLYCDPFVLDEIQDFEKTDLEDRAYPLYLFYPELEQSRVTITWDSALAADSIAIPGRDSVSYPFGELHLDSRQSGDTVFVDFRKSYHAYQLEVDQFADFEAFRDRNKDIIRRYVKLVELPSE